VNKKGKVIKFRYNKKGHKITYKLNKHGKWVKNKLTAAAKLGKVAGTVAKYVKLLLAKHSKPKPPSKAAKKAAKQRAKLAKAQKKLAAQQAKIAEQQEATNALLNKLMSKLNTIAKTKKRAPTHFVVKKAKKDLKAAQKAQIQAEEAAFTAKQKLRKLKRRQSERLRAERAKCNGKCPREFPIYVGPKNVPSTETRSVVVIGNKAHNKARWSKIKTHKKLLWSPKGIKKTRKHLANAASRIVAAAKKRKAMNEAVPKHVTWV